MWMSEETVKDEIEKKKKQSEWERESTLEADNFFFGRERAP